MKSLGGRLKIIRGKDSRRDFAQRLNIHQNTYGNYENGERSPDADFLERICRIFEINPTWLLTGNGMMTVGQNGDDTINITEGRLMTDLVLMSGTQYAEALWSNLKSFAEAVRKEAKVKDLEKKMDLMLEKMADLEARLATQEEKPEKKSLAS